MVHERNAYVLHSRGRGQGAPVLTGVEAAGQLDSTLFELTLRQSYRNPGPRPIEAVYTFPLPGDAVLLGFASELNGERNVGVIVPRAQAERRYEEAVGEGDTPVLLEAHGRGLHTANIGNLQPGDQVVIEVRFAQILAFEQGRVRIALPMTVAPRYGNARDAGLEPEQVPEISLDTEHRLRLSLSVSAIFAKGRIECPTHAFVRHDAADGSSTLTLADRAYLDRDVVIIVEPREPMPSLVLHAQDLTLPASAYVAMGALRIPPAPLREQVALKVLVDCSGSMAGDSIASARAALGGLLPGLRPGDEISLSRFGSTVEHVIAPARCRPEVVTGVADQVERLQADLGGTEMEMALRRVFELPVAEAAAGADVLLITDGEIWNSASLVSAARAGGQRVFAIGVGSSPAEAALRELAEATGGACEFATPGEALQAAACRMLERIRQQPWSDLEIDWGSLPLWQTPLPGCAFGGDTLICFAGTAKRPDATAVRVRAARPGAARSEIARGEADGPCKGDALARIAAARRLPTLSDADALEVAVRYRLMSRATHCIVVHERAAAERYQTTAELYRVPAMLAAGWGASSTVLGGLSDAASLRFSLAEARFDLQASWVDAFAAASPSVWRQPTRPDDPATELARVAAQVTGLLQGNNDIVVFDALARVMGLNIMSAVQPMSGHLGITPWDAFVLLAHWLVARQRARNLYIEGLQRKVDALDAGLVSRVLGIFDRLLDSGSSFLAP